MFSDIGLNERQGASWSKATATEFYRQDELVSIRIYHHWYGSGAAHPNHGISTLNFLGRDFGNIKIEALLAYDKRFSRELMKRCFDEIVVRNASEDGEPASPLFPLDELQNETWANLAQFNFDRQGITFNFAPYQVLAYVYGPQEVIVPWRFLKIADMYRPALHARLNL